jgi:aconitate decarboxylase
LDTIIHPTGPVASALLAVAEWKSGFSGKEFLLALTAGIEAECKVGLAVWPEHYDVGWHITSTTGSIGAAVAVSKLLSLTTTQTAHAIGLAATQVVGLREMFGSHAKSFHPGRAAQNGLMAAVLAQSGYTSSEQALEAKRGWANVVGVTKDGLDKSLQKWLGYGPACEEGGVGLPTPSQVGRWEVSRNSFKPFPCGIVIHPIIDGCAKLHTKINLDGLDTKDIKSVNLRVHPLVLELTGKRTPKDGLEAKFSCYHGAAIGLIYGKGTPKQYEDAVVQDPSLIAVRDKVNATADKSLAADEAEIVLVMNNGVSITQHIQHAVGSTEVPLTNEMLEEKFRDQCASILGDRLDEASTSLWNIESATDVRDIMRCI